MSNEDESDQKVKIALIQQRLDIVWKGFWGIIALGAIWVGNQILKLLGV